MGRWLPDNFMSNVKSVPSSQIQPTKHEVKETFSTNYKLDFTKASNDFWVKKANASQPDYVKGATIGRFGKYSTDLEELFDRLFIMIKECIVSELSKQGYTSETLKHQLSAIETTFKILANSIIELDKEKKVKMDSLYAFLHGFVNSCIENFSDSKDKQV